MINELYSPPINRVGELLKCQLDPKYFINNYVYIYDSVERGWIKFDLWPSQHGVVDLVHNNQLVIILKARQLGQTWTILGYALWSMLFDPISEVLLFSRRDDEAVNLLDNRLKGMYKRLPDWMQAKKILQQNTHTMGLSNGSVARAFPTTAGDSYTATLAMVDEADLITNFNQLMRAVKPTIDNGGKFVLLSRADKDTPQSEFKKVFKDAIKVNSSSPWKATFLPWTAHPNRTIEWYNNQKQDILMRTTALDDLYEQYPSTYEEALLPKTLDKRIPGAFLLKNYVEINQSIEPNDIFIIYKSPEINREYRLGSDPAEGNPTSDNSVSIVVDKLTGEEVAVVSGKFQIQVFAEYTKQLSELYNNCPILVERNNHGHAQILYYQELYPDEYENWLLKGYDDKYGWLNNSFGKSKLYTDLVDLARTNNILIHTQLTYEQLTFIEGKTLRAPDGEMDDYALSFSIAQVSRKLNIDIDDFQIIGGNGLYASKRNN